MLFSSIWRFKEPRRWKKSDIDFGARRTQFVLAAVVVAVALRSRARARATMCMSRLLRAGCDVRASARARVCNISNRRRTLRRRRRRHCVLVERPDPIALRCDGRAPARKRARICTRTTSSGSGGGDGGGVERRKAHATLHVSGRARSHRDKRQRRVQIAHAQKSRNARSATKKTCILDFTTKNIWSLVCECKSGFTLATQQKL